EEAGKFIGLTNIATAGAGIFGRLLGPAIDGINNLWPGQFLGYPFLFATAGVLAVIGTIVLTSKVFPAFKIEKLAA
ncbi:MAG: hypothetical protein HGA53_05480, partial [Anaerolineaceae bacterium]|nr:hypothetical protein [Anaerolineaceae bacterium]